MSSTPSLFRAVAECTQPYGPLASGSSVRSLQSYFGDEQCVEVVYRAILARACAEPQSEAVIAKCIALIKQYVGRHTPSMPVLEAISDACQRLAATLPPNSGLHKSLLYLETSVARLAGKALNCKRLTALTSRPGSHKSSEPWSPAVQPNGPLLHSGLNLSSSFRSMHNSVSEDTTHEAQRQQQQTAAAADSYFRDTPEQHRQAASAQTPGGYPGPDGNDIRDTWGSPSVHNAVRIVDTEPCLPKWTFQPSAMQGLWGGQTSDDGEDTTAEHVGDMDWSVLLPQYSPSLVPLVEGLPGMEVLYMLSCQDLMHAITDVDQDTQLRHMQEIAEVRRIQGGVTPEFLQQAVQQGCASRPRRMFQPLAYMQQDPLDTSSTDVAAVVEIMCGKPSPAAASVLSGTVGLEDSSIYWQQQAGTAAQQAGTAAQQQQQQQQQPLLLLYPSGQQEQQQVHYESMGQIASCILVKLIVDLWLAAGSAAAFPLVLQMLQQALYQPQADYRVRAFDILYNLSLHGCMLVVAAAAPSPNPGLGEAVSSSSNVQDGQQQQQQQPRSPLQHLYQGSSAAAAGPLDSSYHRLGAADWSPPSAVSAGSHRGSESPSSGGFSGADSPVSSPRIHLAPQLLAQRSPTSMMQQQQPAGTPSPPFSSESPLPSPRGKSRLSRIQETGQQRQRSAQEPGSTDHNASTPAAADETAAAASVTAAVAEQLPVQLKWESWLQQLLYELLLMLATVDEQCEAVWQAALGCLLQLTTQAGHWVAASLSPLSPTAAAALLDACVKYSWSHELHAHLVQMAVNLLYVTEPTTAASVKSLFAAAAESSSTTPERKERPQQQQHSSPDQHGQGRGALARSSHRWQPQHHRSSPAGVSGNGSPGAQEASTDSEGGDAHAASAFVCDASQQDTLPCWLHAGPVDPEQLVGFGGSAKLLQHFCHASSVEAQRTLLVPLLQSLMPGDASDDSQLGVLQVLCSSPNCLAALQSAVSVGLPGWADSVLAAVTQHTHDRHLDLQLLASVLLRFEELAIGHFHAGASDVLLPGSHMGGQQQHHTGAVTASQHSNGRGSSRRIDSTSTYARGSMPAEVEAAMQLTLQQLVGNLPAQAHVRPGVQGSDRVAYQMPAGVQGAWRALKTLCWCDDDEARQVVWHWVQRLLALTLQQALKGTILLPLPGVTQRPVSAASAPAGGRGQDAGVANSVAAAVTAACESWVDILVQLMSHCPKGPDTLVGALQLHIACCKLQLRPGQPGSAVGSSLAAAAAAATATGFAEGSNISSARRHRQQQQQWAAAARMCVQAWAFVCQWVMQAKSSTSQPALARLAAIAQSLGCVLDVPRWFGKAQHAVHSAAPSSKRAQAGDRALAAVHEQPQEGVLNLEDAVPLPIPSAEPSGLAASWDSGSSSDPLLAQLGGGFKSTHKRQQCWHVQDRVTEPEAVGWPQAFLLNGALLSQQIGQVLSGASLALLLVRLLQCKPPSTVADRGFHGKPRGISSAATAANSTTAASAVLGSRGGMQLTAAAGKVLPHPVLYPWSDGRQDLQLALLLVLISSSSADAGSFAEYGVEAVTQQVLSSCQDPRACLLVSQFMLGYLMRHQQQRYWGALRQLLSAAQQANDERLLGNPFLQLVTLLSQQKHLVQHAQPGKGLGPQNQQP